MSNLTAPFSDRFGFRPQDAEIVIREDAPEAVRAAVLMLGYDAGMSPDDMRLDLCEVLLTRPDPGNWSAPNVRSEIDRLIDSAPWYKVYDFAEKLHRRIAARDFTGSIAPAFEARLNAVFRELGVGWKMENGVIVVRASEAFGQATQDAVTTMERAGKHTAAGEIREALKDISRRPHADITGAIQHAMAALECVARDADGSADTLGKIISRLDIPAPLDGALHKLWGFASEQGRHIQEGRDPKFDQAELVVTVASAVSVYLLRRSQAKRS